MTGAMSKKNKAKPNQGTADKTATGSAGMSPMIAGIALGLFIIVAAVWMWKGAHGQTASAAAAASPSAPATSGAPSAAAFAGKAFPPQGHAHLNPDEPDDFVYNSNPPTSGPHKEIFSGQFVSPNPLPPYIQVHLLEHGNVLLQYNCTCPDVASALGSIAYEYDSKLIAPNELQPTTEEVQAAEEAGRAVIVAPNPKMKSKIALTAWTRLATLQSVDKPKIESFISLYLTNAANTSQ
jgi:uncharacterized protein DUF3105